MRLFCYTLVVLSAFVRPGALHAQNSCSDALVIGLGTHAVTAISGVLPAAPRCAQNDQGPANSAIWYRFTAQNDTILHITTSVTGLPNVDTRVHVYRGGCDDLVCVVGNDNGGFGGTSRCSFNPTEGETYWLVFDDRWSAAPFSFVLEELNYRLANVEAYLSFESAFIPVQGNPLGIVDMDGDGLDDALAVTQTVIDIHQQLPEGGFLQRTIPTAQTQYPASWSLCAGDLDNNGKRDLLYGGGYGVTFMFATDDGDQFIERSGPEYVFSQRSNMVDINNDGLLDAFVCHDVAANVRYMNMGGQQLQFMQGMLGNTCGNYGSIWTDVDNDGDMDLFVAKCGCDAQDILLRNEGNGQFNGMTPPLGQFDVHQSWSSAWGDYDNDGDMDVVIGSSSGAVHHLLANNGAGQFTNVTEGSGLDEFFVQGIEWTTHDLNNDGLLDILGAGLVLVNLGDMRFGWNTWSPGVGGVGDLNNDGSLDILGQQGLQYGVPNGNNWLRVVLQGTQSNRDGIGARITVQTASGQQIREIRSGDGFRYMSSLAAHFGLGQDEAIEQVTIRWPSGEVHVLEDVAINGTVVAVEPLPTVLTDQPSEELISLYPVPARDQLRLSGPLLEEGTPYRLVDRTGRVVHQGRLSGTTIAIERLVPGMYALQLGADRSVGLRFIKE
jgi:hypothetical protein